MNRVPGEVDALSHQYARGADEKPGAAEYRRIVENIGRNRVARTCAAGEGYVTEQEADVLLVLALRGLDAMVTEEKRAVGEEDIHGDEPDEPCAHTDVAPGWAPDEPSWCRYCGSDL